MVESGSTIHQQIHILLAEDNPVNQDVIFEMLSSLGCRVKVVGNGKEALEAANCRKFHMILMDCQMPVMDGHDSTRRIRDYEKVNSCGHIPIVGITGKAVQNNYEKCKAAGMDDYLDKPFTIEQLKEIISRWTQIPFQDPIEEQVEDPALFESSPSGFFQKDLYDCLDTGVITSICMLKKGSENILERLVKIYLRDAPIHFLEIRKGIYEKNPEKIFQATHSLKSSSANLGAMVLASMSQELEMNARSRRIADAQSRLAAMESEYIRVAAALKSITENPGTPDRVIPSCFKEEKDE